MCGHPAAYSGDSLDVYERAAALLKHPDESSGNPDYM